jgi:hypothetical protein
MIGGEVNILFKNVVVVVMRQVTVICEFGLFSSYLSNVLPTLLRRVDC